MRTLLCFLLTAIAPVLRAQDYVEPSTNDQPNRKNSIGIYATSQLSTLLGSFPDSPRLGALYRMQSSTHTNRTFRVQIVADLFNPLKFRDYDLAAIESITEETVAFRWENIGEQKYTIRLGREWSDPQEAFTPVYGADLIAGVHVRTEQRGRITYRRQPDTDDIRPLLNDEGFVEYARDQTRIQYVIGAAFSAGFRYRLQNRWDFILQISPELYYSPYEHRINRIGPGFQTDGRISDLWFQLRLVEFQIAYRF